MSFILLALLLAARAPNSNVIRDEVITEEGFGDTGVAGAP
jgi:hypothetical protein